MVLLIINLFLFQYEIMTDVNKASHLLFLFDHLYDEYFMIEHDELTEVELYISISCVRDSIRCDLRSSTRLSWLMCFGHEIKSLLNLALIPGRQIPLRLHFLITEQPRHTWYSDSSIEMNGMIALINQHILTYYENNAWHHLT